MLVVLNGSRWYMSKNYMVIIVKPPNKRPYVIKIPKRIRDMVNLVGGMFNAERYEDVLIIYNQNQKDENLKSNKVFKDLRLKGTILIVGNNEKEGDIISLRKKQILKYMSKITNKNIDKENEI